MKVKKIKCLVCDTVVEANFTKKVYYAKCRDDCPNKVELLNRFTLSQPGSYVKAIDKTKVKAYDEEKEEWFYLIEPETKDTPKYTKWLGRYGGDTTSGFFEGLLVEFCTEPMTINECRMHIKKNFVAGNEGRIYHVIKPIAK